MADTVLLKRSAEKELDALPEKIHQKVIDKLLTLQDNPRPQNVKKLRGKVGYRIRVGDYRILYVIDESEKEAEIYSVAHRKDVYR